MKGAVAMGLLAMALFLITIIIMIASGSGKSRQTIVAIVSCFAASIILGSYSVYALINEVNVLATDTDKQRSGEEIYEHYYGSPRYPCLKIIDHADYMASSGGDWLHFNTCPAEFNRTIRQYQFEVDIDTNTNEWINKPVPGTDWFKPETLGEGRLKFSFPPAPETRLIIYTNSDSTEVFMVSYN